MGMANSAEFKKFMDPLKIKFVPCSTASPWSNGAAERAVQSIKKAIRHFVIQEKSPDTWDEYLHFFSNAHNKSANVYNYSPEELHFGISNPNITDLIELWPHFSDRNEYMEKIIPLAEVARDHARYKATSKMDKVLTYRNQSRKEKTFKKGQIVLHRQLQVSTGQGGALKPLFTGPYVIDEIDEDKSSAKIVHMQTNNDLQAHFSNIQLLRYDPSTARLPSDIDESLSQFLPEKDSSVRYYRAPYDRLRNMRSNDDYSSFSYEENDSYNDSNEFYNTQNLTQNNSYNDENNSQDLIQFEEQVDFNSNPFEVNNSFNNDAEDRNTEREENLASNFRDFSPTCATPNKEPIVHTKNMTQPSHKYNLRSKPNQAETDAQTDKRAYQGESRLVASQPILGTKKDDILQLKNRTYATLAHPQLTIDDPHNLLGCQKQDGSYDFSGLNIDDPHNLLGLREKRKEHSSSANRSTDKEYSLHNRFSSEKDYKTFSRKKYNFSNKNISESANEIFSQYNNPQYSQNLLDEIIPDDNINNDILSPQILSQSKFTSEYDFGLITEPKEASSENIPLIDVDPSESQQQLTQTNSHDQDFGRLQDNEEIFEKMETEQLNDMIVEDELRSHNEKTFLSSNIADEFAPEADKRPKTTKLKTKVPKTSSHIMQTRSKIIKSKPLIRIPHIMKNAHKTSPDKLRFRDKT
jgi:hypothetical protein